MIEIFACRLMSGVALAMPILPFVPGLIAHFGGVN